VKGRRSKVEGGGPTAISPPNTGLYEDMLEGIARGLGGGCSDEWSRYDIDSERILRVDEISSARPGGDDKTTDTLPSEEVVRGFSEVPCFGCSSCRVYTRAGDRDTISWRGCLLRRKTTQSEYL